MGSAVGDYDNDGDLDWFVSAIWSGDTRVEVDRNRRLKMHHDPVAGHAQHSPGQGDPGAARACRRGAPHSQERRGQRGARLGRELRRACGRRSSQAQWTGLGSGGIRATPDAAHPTSSRTLERRPGRARAPSETAPAARHARRVREPPLRASGRGRARAAESRSHTPATGSLPASQSKARPAGGDPRPTDARALRTYRGRSTCASILPQFREKLVQRCDGWGCRRRGGRGRDWWCEPAVPHCIGQHRIGQQRAPRRVRGTELGHYPVTVRDKNGFA